ncbi:tryptophan synthase subunit beta [Chlamydia caviae]|uniref:Tryptophan synthase beta chain 1 n=1 Tax=Chlamydia caviae (strain ATCC VR-813 / DSM 19441 / 03DC25 / GPIC) TaxID=227941 RepID=TRPB1_CHLCV|nr:tryptophan synthase subunit beta [Chlamydia caviae]Q822W9.1 RecName: Full=Tryptophan synthase beta chain 1 [Chlamydia caviae GPIC]AAP05302.1 tryptophan synthase, beta subunit [Chlamydia caviae GPIC]
MYTCDTCEEDLDLSLDLGETYEELETYGGQYVPLELVKPLEDLDRSYEQLKKDPQFRETFHHILKNYAGRPTPLTEVKNFSRAINGPRIFLKREDLLHTGAHKINNVLGQCLIAKFQGKTRVVAETGAGQHGVALAAAAAYLGMECVIFMGETDINRQKPNVDRIRVLGAEVVSVKRGNSGLKEAVDAAIEDFIFKHDHTHFCIGSALGPYPYPKIVRDFQSVISLEVKSQIKEYTDRDPDILIACVGGGSNAIGFFHHFIPNTKVKLVGVEGGGLGVESGKHAARFATGKPGVVHGFHSYVLQDEDGNCADTYSISAGLDYVSVGPTHAEMHESGRAQYTYATDDEALEAFRLLSKTEGIIPALESSHALAHMIKIAPSLDKDTIAIVNLSGRGDKDLSQIIDLDKRKKHS